MSKQPWWVNLILVVGLLVLMAVAVHFGWIAEAPPLLAPGIH